MSLESKFGKQLVKLRHEVNMTQQVLSDKTGLSIRSITKLETGVNGTTFCNLEPLANALGVEVKDLFDFE